MPDSGLSKFQKNNLKSWVLILPDTVSNSHKPAVIVKLRHPRSGKAALFLIADENKELFEIIKCREKKGSWFINDSVKEDGTLFITTKIDPLFLILPYLIRSKVQPIEDILVDSEYIEIRRLSDWIDGNSLSAVADKKGTAGVEAWHYNLEKTLKWLEKKVANTEKAIAAMLPVGESSVMYAFNLVSEYLPDELTSKLRLQLNLPEDEEPKTKRKSSKSDLNESSKRQKVDGKKEKGMTAKEKQNLKAAAGSKSITSFFKKM